MQLEDYDEVKPIKLLPIDKWILEKIKILEKNSIENLNQYETGLAKHDIDEFFWNDFCDNYLEIIKDRLYKPEIHGKDERLSGQYTLYNALLEILKLYSIYVPHITEEVYQSFYRNFENCISIHKMQWSMKFDNNDENILQFGENVKKIIGEVRRYKSERNLSLKEKINILKISIPKSYEEYITQTLKDIKACTWAEDIEVKFSDKYDVEIL